LKKLDIVSYKEALAIALKNAVKELPTEVVFLSDSLGRVLSEDIIVKKNVPSFNNSAMDGFAFRHQEIENELKVASVIYAGDKPKEMLKPNECYKIMTGAKVPDDVDTVVAIEDCLEATDSYIKVPSSIKKGNALRYKGEELKKGELLFKKGERITSSVIALLAAQGIATFKVYKDISIAVASTGNELKEPWEEASEDEIYNANSFAIIALLKEYEFKPDYVGLIPDDLDSTVAFISKLKSYDVIITTGGISMGDADFLEEAFLKNGLNEFFHGVNIKPGRPTMMGSMDKTFVMAMPGNPLTTMLNMMVLSIPILLKLQGVKEYHLKPIKATNKKSFKFRPNRTNIVLGKVENTEFKVTRDNKIGSGMLLPLFESNALMITKEGVSEVKEGEEIEVFLIKN